jgi:hypothetical protein
MSEVWMYMWLIGSLYISPLYNSALFLYGVGYGVMSFFDLPQQSDGKVLFTYAKRTLWQ